MSRLLWFVLGGIATAVGTGIAAVMLDEGQEGDSVDDTDANQRDIEVKGQAVQEDNVSNITEIDAES